MAHYGSSFIIERLVIDASIGVYESERVKKQPVALSVRLYFPTLPGAVGDDAATFIDYSALAKRLTGLITSKHFQLIEYMAGELFTSARAYVNEHGGEKVGLWLKLTKCQPEVPYLTEGASFVLSDLTPDATVVAAE